MAQIIINAKERHPRKLTYTCKDVHVLLVPMIRNDVRVVRACSSIYVMVCQVMVYWHVLLRA